MVTARTRSERGTRQRPPSPSIRPPELSTPTFEFNAVGDRFFAGDWTGDGIETPGTFDPAARTVHLKYDNATGGPNESYAWGASSWIPVAGSFGDLASSVTVNVDGAPQGLAWALESLYLELDAAPYYEGPEDQSFSLAGVTDDLGVEGTATTAEAYGGQVAVVTTDTDTILAVSDDGWSWRAVGGTLASGEFSLMASAPRFVTIIGADANDPDESARVVRRRYPHLRRQRGGRRGSHRRHPTRHGHGL